MRGGIAGVSNFHAQGLIKRLKLPVEIKVLPRQRLANTELQMLKHEIFTDVQHVADGSKEGDYDWVSDEIVAKSDGFIGIGKNAEGKTVMGIYKATNGRQFIIDGGVHRWYAALNSDDVGVGTLRLFQNFVTFLSKSGRGE